MGAKHTPTPTPWGWYFEDSSMATLCGKDGSDPQEHHVLSVSPCKCCQERDAEKHEWTWGRCTTPNEANAALIVRAVNAHDDLVEALRAVNVRQIWDMTFITVTVSGRGHWSAEVDTNGRDIFESWLAQARAALAKAEGKVPEGESVS